MSTIRITDTAKSLIRPFKYILEANNDAELIHNIGLVLHQLGEKEVRKQFEKAKKQKN